METLLIVLVLAWFLIGGQQAKKKPAPAPSNIAGPSATQGMSEDFAQIVGMSYASAVRAVQNFSGINTTQTDAQATAEQQAIRDSTGTSNSKLGTASTPAKQG